MRAVYLKELKSYFHNPLGYVFMGLALAVFGFYHVIYNYYYQYADYYWVLDACTSLILFIFPLITMRTFSEETRNKTDQILLTAPIRTGDIVMGKFLAVESIFVIMLILTLVQPLVLVVGFNAEMNTGMLWGGYLGFFLLGTSFIAIGMFISSKTDSQLVAGLVTMAIFMLLNLANGIYNALPTSRYFSLGVLIALLALVCYLIYRAIKDAVITSIVGVAGLAGLLIWFFISPSSFDSLIITLLQDLSIFDRYSDIFTGMFEISHILFFLSITFFFLFLTYESVERRRWA